MKTLLFSALSLILLQSCTGNRLTHKCDETCANEKTTAMNEVTEEKPIACKLTTPELRQRKETVLAELKKAVLEKKELPNGYAYRFKATDEMLDRLTEFIKTERMCCDFFDFTLSVQNDNIIWLEISGRKGVKEFIEGELEI